MNFPVQVFKKTWGFRRQFTEINQGVNGHTTKPPPGYHTPEQVSNPEPMDSRPCILTTTLLWVGIPCQCQPPLEPHASKNAKRTSPSRNKSNTVRNISLKEDLCFGSFLSCCHLRLHASNSIFQVFPIKDTNNACAATRV